MNRISVFEQPKPRFTPEEAAGLLRRDYGLQGMLSELVSERDQNFLVETPQGRFVLKIANAAEDRSLLDLQNAALRHLETVEPSLGLPRLVPGRAGSHMTEWKAGSGPHAVRLLTYLPGQLFSAAPKTPALLASLGRLLGRFSHAMRGFGHPAAHRPGFLWNLDEVMALKPWIEDIASEQRSLVRRI
ncbi:MAG: serine kinase, partial [Hyphomicrobiales bacterium]